MSGKEERQVIASNLYYAAVAQTIYTNNARFPEKVGIEIYVEAILVKFLFKQVQGPTGKRVSFTLEHGFDCFHLTFTELLSSKLMLLECLGCDRTYLSHQVKNGLCVDSDLILCMGIKAELQEVEQIMEVHLPVPFGVEAQGKIDSAEFPRDTHIQEFLVGIIAPLLVFAKNGENLFSHLWIDWLSGSSLLVVITLEIDMGGIGLVALITHDTVPSADLIHPACTVADPLPGNENRHLHMEGEVYLFKGGCMVVSQEVVDQALVLSVGLGTTPVGDPCTLYDSLITSQVVNQAYKTMIKYGEFLIQNLFSSADDAMCHNDSTPSCFWNIAMVQEYPTLGNF